MYLKDKLKPLRVRVSAVQFEKLKRCSESSGLSISELIRQAIDSL